jgi:Mg-chelatase subunit ChlD
MARRRVDPIRGALAYLSLVAFLFLSNGGAQAQPSPSAAPATLRLAQVVVRLPIVHFYAIAQNENGQTVAPQPDALTALIGPNKVPVRDINQQPEGIGIVFLIDVSKSLTGDQFAKIKASVRAWVESLGPSDWAAIVTLGSSVKTVQDFTNDKPTLNRALEGLEPRDMQTLLYQGLVQAIDLSRRLDVPPLRRAIVTLTDGRDDQQGGAGRQEVFDKLAVDPTPIYGLGASADYNAKDRAKVDAALKDFSALVRVSGGDYRRIDTRSLDKAYVELRDIVRSTKHFNAECENPPCAPDGSAMVVRLFMSQGTTSLSSESVTVRSVGAEGKVVQSPRPEPTPPPSTPLPGPPEPSKPDYRTLVFKFFTNLPLRWLTVLALIAGGSIAGVVIFMRRSSKQQPKGQEPLKTTRAEPDNSVLQISPRVLVPSGTQQDKQRLRLYPIGHNDIGPFDLLFEETLAVGRSPESEICISNDGQVSASHCALSPKGKSILVEDAGSRNGTRINGVPINGFLHAEPDSVLGVGRTELRMKLLPVGTR